MTYEEKDGDWEPDLEGTGDVGCLPAEDEKSDDYDEVDYALWIAFDVEDEIVGIACETYKIGQCCVQTRRLWYDLIQLKC